MINRKTVRAALVTKIKTITILADESGTTPIPHVLPYLATDFQGKSPMCTVESYRTKLGTENEGDNEAFRFVVGMWVKRDEGSASAAEDTLDDLEYALRDVIRDNYNGRFTQDSEPSYDVISGEDYRVEFHFIELDWS